MFLDPEGYDNQDDECVAGFVGDAVDYEIPESEDD